MFTKHWNQATSGPVQMPITAPPTGVRYGRFFFALFSASESAAVEVSGFIRAKDGGGIVREELPIHYVHRREAFATAATQDTGHFASAGVHGFPGFRVVYTDGVDATTHLTLSTHPDQLILMPGSGDTIVIANPFRLYLPTGITTIQADVGVTTPAAAWTGTMALTL